MVTLLFCLRTHRILLMNIDLLPFTAFALQSCGQAARAQGDGQTLTLQLALVSDHSCHEPMNGRASTNQAFMHCGNLLRAAVVPAEGPVLTITF
jgi:hypothetical protein